MNNTTATAGSTGNSFIFTFTGVSGENFNSGSQATLTVPSGWTAPQSSVSGNPGFVSVEQAGSTVGTISISGSTITIPFTTTSNSTFTVTYAGGGTAVTANSRRPLHFHDPDQAERRNTYEHCHEPHGRRNRGGSEQAGVHDRSGRHNGRDAFTTQPVVQTQDAFDNPSTVGLGPPNS